MVRASHKSPPPAKPLVELRQLLAERGDALMYLRVNTWPRSLWETSGQQVCHTQMVHFRDAVPKSDPTKIDHDQTFPRMPGRQFRKKEGKRCVDRGKSSRRNVKHFSNPLFPPRPRLGSAQSSCVPTMATGELGACTTMEANHHSKASQVCVLLSTSCWNGLVRERMETSCFFLPMKYGINFKE